MKNEESRAGNLAEHVRAIIANGNGIRENIAKSVREAGATIHDTGESLRDISKVVIDEAVGAASAETVPDSALREVIDGVGDGVESVAQAMGLALDEARGKGKEYVKEDLGSLGEDLSSIASLFVETTEGALRGAGGQLKDQISGLLEHAERTAQRVRPGLESVAARAAGDPVDLVKDAARAGAAAGRHGVGALFVAIGNILRESGSALEGKSDEEE